MLTISIDNGPARINITALDAALRAELGDGYQGLSTGGADGLRLHLAAEPTPEQLAAAQAIVAAHDPDALTADQQAAAARVRQLADLSAQVRAVDLSQPLNAEAADLVTRYLTLRLLNQ